MNNTPIEKNVLNNIVDEFESKIDINGYHFIYEKEFKALLSQKLQQLFVNSSFENSIFKPKSDSVNIDTFKFSFSPSINIKKQKPRFFDKLTSGIIRKSETNESDSDLFNLISTLTLILNQTIL